MASNQAGRDKTQDDRVTRLVQRVTTEEGQRAGDDDRLQGQVDGTNSALNALADRVAALEAAAKPTPPIEEGKVLFSLPPSLPAPHAKAVGGWYLQANPGRVSAIAEGLRYEIRPGDVEADTKLEMAELSMVANLKAGEGVWVRERFRRPSMNSAHPAWFTGHEWHDASNAGLDGGSFSPAVALFCNGDPGTFYLKNGKGSPTYWTGPQIEDDRWYDLLYRMLVDRTAGELEVYWDGKHVADFKGPTTNTGLIYLKSGAYRARGTSGTTVWDTSGPIIASTKAAALAA